MKIGFIGLGIMGSAMCSNIIKKSGDTVYAYDVNPDAVAKMAALGAVPCGDSLTLAKNSDVVISMVPRSEHVRAVYEGILPALGEGKICIDMSTIDPSVSVEVSEMVKAAGAQFADAPVVKSKAAAEAGTLGIYAGCEPELLPVIEPILLYMGCKVKYMGKNGSGLVMKICQNALVAQIQNGVNETLTLAGKFGVSPADFCEAVSMGGAQNSYIEAQHEKLAQGDLSTAFSLENMNKDLGICKRLSEQVGVDMPGEAVSREVYARCMEKGLGKLDFRTTYFEVSGEPLPEGY